ncbi:MAG: nitroreductase [Thermodesulfovibrionales bacterium]
MNPVIDAIRKRRSVRSFAQVHIPRDIMEVILEAGNQAPSAMNSQPWRFVVVEDRRLRKKLIKAARPYALKFVESLKDTDPEKYEALRKRQEEADDPIFYSAPAIIFVIGRGHYADASCPLACENIMLAAHSLGLGTCWIGLGAMVADDPEVREALEMGADEKIFGPIAVGTPEEYPEPPAKRPPDIKWI